VDEILAYNVDFLKFPDVFNGVDVGFTLDHDDLKVWAMNDSIQSSPSQRPGDLNDDGKVDFLDLLIVVGQFRKTGASIANTRADINNDGIVNLFDFVLLARNWGRVYSTGGSSEPSYNPGTQSLIDNESFDGFSTIANGGTQFASKYPVYRVIAPNLTGTLANAESNGVVTLTTGRGGTGKALELKYAGATGAEDIIVGPETRLSSIGALNGVLPQVAGPYTHFFFQTWIRFSAGADPGLAPNGGGVKGVMLWHNGNQRYQHSPHTISDYYWTGYPETRWDAGPPHPPNNWTHGTHLNHWRTANGEAPYFAPYADGNWHRFTTESWVGPDPIAHRGERWWLDGVLVFDNMDNVGNPCSWSNDPTNTSCDYNYTNPITHWMVFGNFGNAANAAAVPTFTVDFDDWIAWTGP